MSQVVNLAGAYPGFCSIQQVFLLPDGMLVFRKVSSKHLIHQYSFIHLGEESCCEIKL